LRPLLAAVALAGWVLLGSADGSLVLLDPMQLHGDRIEPQELQRVFSSSVLSLAASTRDPARQLIAVGYENGVTHVITLIGGGTGLSTYFLRAFYSPPVMSVAFVETESAIYVATAAGRGFRLFTLDLSSTTMPTVEIYNHTRGAVVIDIAVSMGGP
jgi:hypothetical protein